MEERAKSKAVGTAQRMGPEQAQRAIGALQTLKQAQPTFKDALQVVTRCKLEATHDSHDTHS